MSSRIDFLALSIDQRQAAARVVAAASEHMHWERLEAVFRSLARAEWLIVPRAHPLQGELPMTIPTLLRNERVMATAIVLALHMYLDDEESAEQVIQFLAQHGAALDALFVNEAAVTGKHQSDQQQQQALS